MANTNESMKLEDMVSDWWSNIMSEIAFNYANITGQEIICHRAGSNWKPKAKEKVEWPDIWQESIGLWKKTFVYHVDNPYDHGHSYMMVAQHRLFIVWT